MQDIFRKIRIIMGIGTTHIIIHLSAALCCLFKFRHDLIIAALTASVRTHSVMHFLTAVNAQYHISHFFIDKLQNLII